MTDKHTAAHIPDDAVQAKRHLIQSYDWSFLSTGVDAIDDILASIADAAESYHNTSQWHDEGHIQRIQKLADVAASHLSAPCAVEVLALDWTLFNSEKSIWIAESPLGLQSRYAESAAAAQADFERRILSCVVTKPVDVAAVRRQAFDEGFENGVEQSLNALYAYDDITRNEAEQSIMKLKPDYRALSDEPAQGDQWQPIETAPKDGTVILAWHITHKCPVPVLWKDDGFPYQGERLNWFERTYTTAWPERAFSHWMPLPAAPTTEE